MFSDRKPPFLWRTLILTILTACAAPRPDDAAVNAYLDAKGCYMNGELDEAISRLESIAAREDGFHQAALLLGRAYLMAGRIEEAAEVLTGLEKAYPRYGDAQLWLIRALIASGRLDSAEETLNRALEFAGEDPRLLHAAGSLWEARGNDQKALEYYRKASMYGDDLANVYLSLGKIYGRFRIYEKYLEYIDRCLAVLPQESVLRRPVTELRARVQEELP